MSDPWTNSNQRRDNPTMGDRKKQATREMNARIDAASAPKPKKLVERPYKPDFSPR